MGYAGQASFGQNAFAAIGGYTSAVLTTAYSVAPLLALAARGVRCGDLRCADRLPDPAAEGALSRDGDACHRSDRVRGRGAVAVDHPRLYGNLRNPAAWHRELRGGERSRAAGVARASWSRCAWGARGSFAIPASAAPSWRFRAAKMRRARSVSMWPATSSLPSSISAVYAAVAGSLFVHVVGFVSPEVFGMNMVSSASPCSMSAGSARSPARWSARSS